jgi:hypothetical protein
MKQEDDCVGMGPFVCVGRIHSCRPTVLYLPNKTYMLALEEFVQ